MKNRIKALGLSLALLASLLLGGCGESQPDEGDLLVYYLNLDATEIVSDYCPAEEVDGLETVDAYLTALQTNPKDTDLRRTIPESVQVLSYEKSQYFLTIDFSQEYYDISSAEEVLIRAAIVKTMVQVEDVAFVSFEVEGNPLKNARGETVGRMNADTFVENAEQSINTTTEAQLVLYFASADGTYLVRETQTVHYSSNESLEKLIVEKLIAGPTSSSLQATIPSGTNIINVSVMDGVCYVNLDENFNNQNQEITEGVVLYSIVNSLTELDEVEKVQISINGDSSGKCRYNYDLSTMYTEDDSFLTPPEEEEISTEESTQL